MCTSSQNSDTEITSTTTKTSSKSTKNNDSVKSINSNSHSTSTIIINKFNMLTSTTTASANQYLRPEYLPPVSSPVSFFFFYFCWQYFSTTKIGTENVPGKSVWKSSPNPKPPTTDRTKLDRSELLKSLDKDFSHVKEEMTLFEIVNRGTYRGYFIAIIANCLFWIFCANILYKFYSFIGKREKVIERQQLFEQTKHQMKNGDRIMEYLSGMFYFAF